MFRVRRHFSFPARFPSCPNLAARHQRDDAESKRQQQKGLATLPMHSCVAVDADVRDGCRGWAWGVCRRRRRRRRRLLLLSCAGRGEPVRRRNDARRCRQAENAAAASLGCVGSRRGHGTGCLMVGVGGIDEGACFDEQEVLFGPWGRCNAYWPAGRHDGSGAMATSSRGQHGRTTTQRDRCCCYVQHARGGDIKRWLTLFRLIPTPHLQPASEGASRWESHVRSPASAVVSGQGSLWEPPKPHVETERVVCLACHCIR